MDWELEALKSCAPKKALRRPEPRAQAEDAVQAMLRAHTRLGLGDRAAVGMLHAPRGATLSEPEESGAMNWIAICATALALPLLTSVAAAIAQSTVYTTVNAQSEKPVRLGVYAGLNKDSSQGPLPEIKVTQDPTHGVFVIRKGNTGC